MNESLFCLFCSLLLWELVVVLLLPSTYFSLSLPTLILQLNLNEIPREESDNTWKGISRFSAGFPLILPYVYINGHTMAATLQKMYWFKLHTSIYFLFLGKSISLLNLQKIGKYMYVYYSCSFFQKIVQKINYKWFSIQHINLAHIELLIIQPESITL